MKTEYYKNYNVPDDWDTLEDFVNWAIESKFPIVIPWDAEVRRTEDTTTICLFRKGQYQIELYLIYPGWVIPMHGHPNVEVITMIMGGGKRGAKNELGGSSLAGTLSEKLHGDMMHGGETSTIFSTGYCLYSFEKWPKDTKITSAALHWKGKTAGPIHDALIEKYYPGAVKEPGYADVTGILTKF